MPWTADEARAAVVAQLEETLPDLDISGSRVDGAHVVVEFAAPHQPGCRYAMRWPAADEEGRDLDAHASLAAINLQELIEAVDLGLPGCEDDALVWLDL